MRHHVDHSAVGQLTVRGVRPVAVGVSSGLADRIAVAIGNHDGNAGLGSTADLAAIARVDLRRIGEIGSYGGNRRAAVASRVGHYHGNRLAIGQRRLQRHLEAAVGTGHHAHVRLTVAVGVYAHRGARFGIAGEDAAIRRNLQTAGCRWRSGVRRTTATATATPAAAVGNRDAAADDRRANQQCGAGAQLPEGNTCIGE
ncbi:hypothetical protein D9M71_221870 [compost metagenome]